MSEITLTMSADVQATLASMHGAMDMLQTMVEDGTLDRAADAIEAEQRTNKLRQSAIDAALAGPQDGDYTSGLQIAVYRDGSFVVTQPNHVWEYTADPDYVTTISLAAITVAVAQVLN